MQSMWWFIAAAVLGVAEIFTLDLTLLMLAGGAIAGGGVMLLGGNIVVAAVVAAAVAASLMFALRPWLLRSLRKRGVPLVETNLAALAGATGSALDDISATTGRAKVRGEVWTARVDKGAGVIHEGDDVVVIKIEGATAIVAPVKEQASS